MTLLLSYPTTVSPISFAFGAMIGSFLNVCVLRLPKIASIVTPPSHCPKCKARISFYDNIPLLSYLLLLGRCRFCRERISPRYFFIELLMGGGAVAFSLTFLEALACGTSAIATGVGGIPEQVEDGVTGFLVSGGDAKALAERVGQLLEDDVLLQRIGVRAAAVARERFDRNSQTFGYLDWYETAIMSRKTNALAPENTLAGG
jgi:hypothetical protein